MKVRITSLNPTEIATELGLQPFQGRQVFRWLHQKHVFDFEAMTDLSKELRKELAERAMTSQLTLAHLSTSARSFGTRKALFRLEDGETVEAVLIRDRDRATICLSTQVGCAVKCAFCATGMSGYTRNLNPGEIVEQALYLLKEEGIEDGHPNIVYMGMGEPFRNYDATVRSVRLLMARQGLGIGARRITVSTVGEVPGIRQFAEEGWQIRLSISLHAANNALRSKLVPINRKYPLETLMSAVRDYVNATRRHVTFEWALLNDVNDSPRDAAELAELVSDLQATVNLIPYNPIPEAGFAPPPFAKCEAFRDALLKRSVNTTLRKERGQDINAACGQLRRQLLSA
ncbi:MAG: 23S rRNA (adenine(2503)-C(2))-methyltransferase RlmN [Candidatus Hydrogenedentes bacterium]|nr:23S rRNA (adenine(2503)-C(2))-methyltransferase RlmN [Candidatus Hydrogenedentota bacterium]